MKLSFILHFTDCHKAFLSKGGNDAARQKNKKKHRTTFISEFVFFICGRAGVVATLTLTRILKKIVIHKTS